jgi:hypothetical protein
MRWPPGHNQRTWLALLQVVAREDIDDADSEAGECESEKCDIHHGLEPHCTVNLCKSAQSADTIMGRTSV